MLLARRSFLIASSLAAAPIPAWARGLSRGLFSHGVASGDPLPDGVILWTRFVPDGDGAVAWEIADDENFAHVVQRGAATSRFANDFCVKVDARGLQPGRPYFYRFLSASGPSMTGRTRTAPQGRVDSLTAAFFSCSNISFGYFHTYGHAAQREDVDIVFHLGDYMYESRRGLAWSNIQPIPGRVIDPIGETVTLTDYYQRYACYHQDPELVELRRLKPMSVVWDDHDFANNTWHDGASAHRPEQGSWAARVAAASKAYFDWMPIRRPDARGLRIYRSLDWGDLARILLIDTRYIGRSEPREPSDELETMLIQGGAGVAAAAEAYRRDVLNDPNRSVLGATQEQWLNGAMAESKRNGQPWQLVAQQIVMGDQKATDDLLRLFPPEATARDRAWFETAARGYQYGLPWNDDCWNGYPPAKARFLDSCVANANNVVVLGGDSHNAWVNNLPAANSNRLAGLEFAGGSVSSPGFERSLTNAAPGQRESVLRAANMNLAFCDITNRGYGTVKLSRTACEGEWLAFPHVRLPTPEAPVVTRLQSEASATAGPGGWHVAT